MVMMVMNVSDDEEEEEEQTITLKLFFGVFFRCLKSSESVV